MCEPAEANIDSSDKNNDNDDNNNKNNNHNDNNKPAKINWHRIDTRHSFLALILPSHQSAAAASPSLVRRQICMQLMGLAQLECACKQRLCVRARRKNNLMSSQLTLDLVWFALLCFALLVRVFKIRPTTRTRATLVG